MSTRDKILNKIKKGVAPSVELPDLSVTDSWGGDVNIENLKQVLESVGGEMHILGSINDVDTKLSELFPDVKRVYANVEGVNFVHGNITPDLGAHELAKLEVAVLKGEFAVEENGSVFISDRAMGNKMIPTITEYLVLVVEKSSVVKNMHEAYRRVDLASIDYGVFISGPSKTADIESTLVFGAHGAKNLALLLV